MLFFFYRLAFVLPAIVAGITLVLSWRAGLLRRPIVPLLVFAASSMLQYAGALFSPAWALGLVGNVGLAIVLLIRLRLE